MANQPQLTDADLDALRALDTPTISNCLERLPIRPWTEGFMRPEIRSIMPQQKTVVGYAVTVTMSAVRQSDSPVSLLPLLFIWERPTTSTNRVHSRTC